MKFEEIISKLGDARLIAVSKNVTTKEVINLYSKGQMDFGENRIQELKSKINMLSNLNINWHFIGRLQKNKINQMIDLHPTLWQSCDGFQSAYEVNRRLTYIMPTLLQINSADEITKQGIKKDEAIEEFIKIKEECNNINLIGLMSIGANTNDEKLVQKTFEDTYEIYEKLKKYGAKICSMGMSNDFELALKCGSNMVRLGTILYEK